MAMCYQKHPFEIETADRLTTINTKIFEIKKKIQLSEGQRKSHYEENETERKQNNDLIETLKKEVKLRLEELIQARAVIGEEEAQIKKYLNDVCPIGSKNADQKNNGVLLNGERLEPEESTAFLGLTVELKLHWGPHIDKLASRLSSAAFAIKKIRSIASM